MKTFSIVRPSFRTTNLLLKKTKETYKETIDSAKGDSKKLWKIIDTFINSKNKEKKLFTKT